MPSPRTLNWPFRAGRRTRWLSLLVTLALVGAAWIDGARADDDPAPDGPLEPELFIAEIATDPVGDADLLVGRARRALDEQRLNDAFHALVQLAEQHPDVVVPLGAVLGGDGPEGDGALRWPARIVANLALARFPDPWPRTLEDRWEAEARVLFERGRRGDDSAWPQLANTYGALPIGARTLLFLADADFEAGRFVRAVRRFELWLELRQAAEPKTRALVFARIVDALRVLDDAGGLARLEQRALDLLDVRLDLGGRTTTLRRQLRAASRRRTPKSRRGRPELPDALDLLWTIDTDDPGWQREHRTVDRWTEKVRTGTWTDGETIVIHGGRTVRCLDLATGVENWRFPEGPQPIVHDPDLRYWPHDIPFRSVTRAGDLVLCVLGEPGATASFAFLKEKVEIKDLGQELRMRLVALDAKTGALRWWTGGSDETHPILADRDTGCASPALVAGDVVYSVFARRRGIGEYHLACLDLATGEERWVTRLAVGESGRAKDRSDDDRFVGERLQALAFGARPTLANGEVLALPHAGFAAGVDAESGDVNWVRALPRYAFGTHHGPSSGHGMQNEAVAWGDAWIFAPMDSPRILAVAQGSGEMRWHHGPLYPGEHPAWRHFYGVAFDPEGRPALHLAGLQPILLDARDPSRAPLNGADPEPDAYIPRGRGLELDRVLYRAIDLQLEAEPIDGGGTASVEPVMLTGEAPDAGDVIRAGDVWIVVGDHHVAAFAASPKVLDRDDVVPTDSVRARDAVAAAIRARWTNRPRVLAVAFDRADAIEMPDVKAAAHARLAEELELWLGDFSVAASDPAHSLILGERLEALAGLITRLPPDLRGVAFFHAIDTLIRIGRPGRAVEQIEAWIAEPGTRLVPFPPTDPALRMRTDTRLRGDLAAAVMLERVRSSPIGQSRLTDREQAQDRLVTAALEADEAVLREAIRVAVGTEAASVGRKRLRDRLVDAGRLADAAAIAADLRLAPGPRERRVSDRLLRALAKHQVHEATLLVKAGELASARSLLVDVVRWAPPGTHDVRGRDVEELLKEVEFEEGRRPAYSPEPSRVDLWQNLDPPKERNQISSVQVLPVTGPGANALGDRVPVARGLTFELWSTSGAGRLASLPGEDEGWFGGSLHEVDRWVPGAGILVTSVVAGEPADRSTVRAGDWIRSWNGQRVPDLSSFMRAVAGARPGETIDIEVFRDGRLILDRFRAGRRPIEQRAGLAYAPLWAAADGRLLLPGRTGLSWVDPRLATRTRFWRWDEHGVVARAEVLAGACYVRIDRRLDPDLIVRVDLETATEVWRAEVPGHITRIQTSGSALWVDTREPETAVVIDRHDGSTRAHYDAIPVSRAEYRRTWTSAFTSDASPTGWGYVACGDASAPMLHGVNTTTGVWAWRDSIEPVLDDSSAYLDPYVSADAVVSVVQGPNELMLLVPDPTGRVPSEGERFIVGPNHLRTTADLGGPLDADTRVHVRGGTIYVVRNTRSWRRVTIWILRMNFDLLRGSNTNVDPSRPDPVEHKTNQRILTDTPPGSSQWPYLLHVRPEFDGVYVTAATLANEPYVESWFISDFGSEHLLMEQVNEGRRHQPVRIGESLHVPVDRGIVIVPLERIER